MKHRIFRSRVFWSVNRSAWALICAAALVPDSPCLLGYAPQESAAPPAQEAKIPPDPLDSFVAPIALYPDLLLAQVLAASTSPLELIQLQQWLSKHKDLNEKALADAVAKQPWDPSVQSMAALPDVVSRLANDIKWTTDLGNAFPAPHGDAR